MKHMRKRSFIGILGKVVRKIFYTLKRYISQFCHETGLHGCKYICDTQRPMIERIAWAITVVSSLCIALGLLKSTLNFFAEHFVLSVIETTHNGIWNYPFPAITVCDINRVSLNLTQKFVENLTLPPTVTKEFVAQEMKLLNELLYPGIYGSRVRNNLSQLQNIFDMNKLSIPTIMNSVAQSCRNFLVSCKWKSRTKDCNSIFRPSISRDGVCCSFNYITHDLIMKQPNTKPCKMTSCGYQSGLSMVLNLDIDNYDAGIMESVGVKIMLHDPYDYPDYDAPSKFIGVNKYAFLSIKPVEMRSAADITYLDPNLRQCIFHSEANEIIGNNWNEHFVPVKYSFINCLTNCRASFIKNICGCVPYYYPQNIWYDTSWPGMDMSPKALPHVNLDGYGRPCACMPDCDFYRYVIENSAGDLDKDLTYTYPRKDKTWKNQSEIHIFFGDLVSIQYRRETHYNWRHLFATFGGLLGVFAGFSFMSVVEIIYFFVIRFLIDACVNRNTRNKKN
ncbi:hypothetical protein E2986_12150 [Frieseomelitta varia]|uniref:Sodium channel protein Nach n=1 Tax=Frieseomelitta varia TaxID=561572 RepID=A0A833S1Q2_9HYME|nr:hypothetical protein E2986_12150 [Frieseomelitta varia]